MYELEFNTRSRKRAKNAGKQVRYKAYPLYIDYPTSTDSRVLIIFSDNYEMFVIYLFIVEDPLVWFV